MSSGLTEVAGASAVSLRSVSKRFDGVTAVDGVSIEIRPNEFFSILGPSGCGKTTLLRMIAGFEYPTEGEIFLAGQTVTRQPVRQRNLNLVFQNYALFPHLSVYGNVAFELKVRREPRSTIDARVKDILKLVQLEDYGRRKPSQLSGGQRQRVALARALVGQPAVLLLDEPLGALDQKLRKDMQSELKRLQREVGITFIYVTHDQEEALAMSDRIAVMRSGRVLQIDSPRALYDAPRDTYVAGFIGQSNFLPGEVVSHNADETLVHVAGVGDVRASRNTEIAPGTAATVVFRPERVRVSARTGGTSGNTVTGTLRETVFVGNDTQYVVELADGTSVRSRVQNTGNEDDGVHVGDAVQVCWAPAASRVLAS